MNFFKSLHFLTLLNFTFVCLTSKAIATTTDPLNLDLLKKELSGIKSNEITTGQFEQKKTLKDLKMDILSSGTFEIARFKDQAIKIIWNITQPEFMRICLTEQNIKINTNKNSKIDSKSLAVTTQELATQQTASFKSMLSLMKLDAKEIDKTFNVFKDIGVFVFIPKENSSSIFEKATVKINKENIVEETNITEKSGDVLQIKFFKSKKTQIKKQTEKDC